MNKHVLLLVLGVAGCAQTQSLTYWDKHGSAITVHHVIGKTDQTDTLTTKELKNDQVQGGFKVVTGKVDFKPTKQPDNKSAKERKLSDRVDSLTKQVASLKDQIHSSKSTPTQAKNQTTSTDETNATAEAPNPVAPVASADADLPHVSQ